MFEIRHFYLILAFTIKVTLCIGQSTYSIAVRDTIHDNVIYNIIELSNGTTIHVVNEVFPPDSSNVELWRVDKFGEIKYQTRFKFDSKPTTLAYGISLDDNRLVFAGWIREYPNYKYLYLETDTLFNVIYSKVIRVTGGFQVCNISDLKYANGKVVCSGAIRNAQWNTRLFCYTMTPSLDSLAFKVFPQYHSFLPFSLVPLANGQFYGFVSTSSTYMLKFDSAFSVLQELEISDTVFNFQEAKQISRNNLLLAGENTSLTLFADTRGIGVLKLDLDGAISKSLLIRDNDTIEWPGQFSRIDFVDTNSIFIGGTHNFNQFSEFTYMDSWFMLTRIDTNLNVKWEKFYGGNGLYYTLWGLRATRDGGCLMYGSTFDYTSGRTERDAFAMKVNSDGMLTSVYEHPDPAAHDVIVYPNPGMGVVTIRSGVQVRECVFLLTDLKGREVYRTTLTEREIQADLSALLPGAYLWSVLHNGRVLDSGKWIRRAATFISSQ